MSLLRSYSPQVSQVAPVAPVAQVAGSEQPQYVPVVKSSGAKKRYDKLIEKLRDGSRGLNNNALQTRSLRDEWTQGERRRYLKLRAANDAVRNSDEILNNALRRLGRGYIKDARDLLEIEENNRLRAENRRANAKAYVKKMEKIRRIRRAELYDLDFRNDYYPHRTKMIDFLENDMVLSLVRNRPTKKRLFSKKDLLEAGLLKELYEWIVWPIEVYEQLNREYPDVKFRKIKNRNFEREFWQGYDLKVVSLILSHLLGGIKQRVLRNQRFREEIVYFPFYKSSFKENSTQIMEIEPHVEENLNFEYQREGMDKKTKTKYMQWNLSPYDYSVAVSNQSKSFSRRLWEELGAKELLETFELILRLGNVDQPSLVLFPGLTGLRDWGIQEELNEAPQAGDVGVNYEWPGYKDGLSTLDSPLLVRLKYLISVWSIQKRLVNNTN